MQGALKGYCDLFMENRDVVKSCFSMESTYLYPVCAAIITDRDMRMNPERLKRCRDLLKEQTGTFSQFRGNARLAMIAMMSVDSNPNVRLKNAQQVYDHLKDYFRGSAYLCVAAMVIADLVDPGYYKQMAEHTRHIYGLLKSTERICFSCKLTQFIIMSYGYTVTSCAGTKYMTLIIFTKLIACNFQLRIIMY